MQKLKKHLILLLSFCLVITATIPSKANATTIKLNTISKTLYIGDFYKLELSGVKKSTVKWKSSNKKIVRVSSTGKITGLTSGKAKVTATSKGKTYSCNITIKPRLSVDEKTIICTDFLSYAIFTVKSKKNDDILTFEIANPSILACEWEDWDGSDVKLNFIPLSDGITTVYVTLNDRPDEIITLKVTCKAGSILSVVDEYLYTAAHGYNLLKYTVDFPDSITVYNIWSTVHYTQKNNSYPLPTVTMYYSSINSAGKTVYEYCTFNMSTLDIVTNTSYYRDPYIYAHPYDKDDFYSDFDCVAFLKTPSFPDSQVKLTEIPAEVVQLIADYYTNTGSYIVMQGDKIIS